MQKSRFNAIHAAAATALLFIGLFSGGPAAFWRQFVYGTPMDAKSIRLGLVTVAIFMGTIAAVMFISTCFVKRPEEATEKQDKPNRAKAALFALYIVPPAIGAAMGIQLATAKAIEWVWGIQAADQELVKFFLSPSCTIGIKTHIILSVLVQAPVIEELLFRGVIFRGFARSLPTAAAMAISGFAFAIAHMNAASFFGLWFLGVVFAWAYSRTRTIVAPIVLHCTFNAFNLALLLFFPELVT